jgi:hypothetical protein
MISVFHKAIVSGGEPHHDDGRRADAIGHPVVLVGDRGLPRVRGRNNPRSHPERRPRLGPRLRLRRLRPSLRSAAARKASSPSGRPLAPRLSKRLSSACSAGDSCSSARKRGARARAGRRRRQDDMHVIGHQAMGLAGNAIARAAFGDRIVICRAARASRSKGRQPASGARFVTGGVINNASSPRGRIAPL